MSRVFPDFADLPVREKGLVVVAVPVFALLIVLSALLIVQREEQAAEHWVRHTLEVEQDLQVTLALLTEAESSTRGYLVTRHREWLRPYDEAQRRLPAAFGYLSKLVEDNPGQVARVEQIKDLVGKRLEHLVVLQDYAAQGRTDGLEEALERSRASMDRVRGIVANMTSEEDRLLAQRTEHEQVVRQWLYFLIVASAIVGLAGGLIVAAIFGKDIALRLQQLSDASGLLARRQALPPPDRGKDEIGRLSTVLHEADRLLSQREAELHESQSFLEHLIDTSPTVIFRQDPQTMQITYVSPNAERILGFPAAEIAEPGFWMSHVHPDDREQVLDNDRHAFAEHVPQLELEYRFLHKDGSYRWMDSFVRIEYDESGRPSQFFGHRLDITDRKLAEQSLREREANLDAANKELESFSYAVSHDLRAPLRSIDGFSQALLEDYGDTLAVEARSYLHRVRAATQRMGQLIDDMLNLSRVTRSPLRRATVDLSGMAESIAAELRQTQPERSVEFKIAPGLRDECDANLMRVVLENLMGNAWKFTAKHPSAHIEFSREDGTYSVRDDGAGFDSAYKSKLFGAFQRLHHGSDFAGTGIGLATVQRIVRRHGGKVWAEGAPEKGATFYFTLDA